jgi:dipeptidyl-peptidase-4
MLDENVHFRHTSVLLNELIAENKYHELLLFPDGRHMPTKITDRIYLEDRIFNFIKKNLD